MPQAAGSATQPPPPQPSTLVARGPRVAVRPSSRWQRIRPLVVLASAVIALSVALHLRDPHSHGSWGLCPWLLLTGTSCPGCGGLRAVHDLTNGEVMSAFSSNLLIVSGLPAAVLLWARVVCDRWRGQVWALPPRTVAAAWTMVLTSVVVFWVARNLPVDAVSWMAP